MLTPTVSKNTRKRGDGEETYVTWDVENTYLRIVVSLEREGAKSFDRESTSVNFNEEMGTYWRVLCGN